MTIYEENGFTSRKEYLQSLAEDYDMDYEDVEMLAATLGATEDFVRWHACMPRLRIVGNHHTPRYQRRPGKV